jgi:hypothetical protein
MFANAQVKAGIPRVGWLLLALGATGPWVLLPVNAQDVPAPPNSARTADKVGGAQELKHAGAEVSLELDKAEYFLGENVVLHWRIRNAGDKPITFDIGGDGRTPGANRAIRFKIEATDAAGNAAADPYPNPANMGGPGGKLSLEPGEDFWVDLQLMRYREITVPGEYTITVYHDLGWENRGVREHFDRVANSDIPPAPREAPIVATKIQFLMPNAEQARLVVESMLAMPENPGRTWGEKGKRFPDYELLRYPVYLPIAIEMIRQGDARGLDMIGAMEFPEATAMLLELMKHEDAAIAAKAGDLLFQRMPYVYDVGPSRRNYLLERSWTDPLRKSALAPAWMLLAEDDRESIIRGARFVQSLGNKEDLPTLIEVMDRVLFEFKDDEVEQRAYLRPPTASETLTGASRELLRRGARPPDSTTTPGRAVVWLLGLGDDEHFRPEGWRETARGLVQHDIPFIRDVALRNLPLPLDDATAADVAAAITDEFAPVQGAACELAGKAKLERFREPLIDALENTNNDWVMRAAFSAASECGVENDRRLEICIGRMEARDNDWNMLILSLLKDGALESGGYGAQAIDDWTSILPGIQKAWLTFVDSHRLLLRKGTRFPAGDPPLSPKMFPPGFQLDRARQPPWPENAGTKAED